MRKRHELISCVHTDGSRIVVTVVHALSLLAYCLHGATPVPQMRDIFDVTCWRKRVISKGKA